MKSSDKSPFEHLDVPERMIRKLSDLLKSTDLAEIEIATENMSLRVKSRETHVHQVATASVPTPHLSVAATPKPLEPAGDLHIVRSPFIGSFYRAPSPTSAVFVEEGQSVSKGQVLCIVEAMKIMNEIEADASGVIEKIFPENGSPVDYNAPLFGIKKAGA